MALSSTQKQTASCRIPPLKVTEYCWLNLGSWGQVPVSLVSKHHNFFAPQWTTTLTSLTCSGSELCSIFFTVTFILSAILTLLKSAVIVNNSLYWPFPLQIIVWLLSPDQTMTDIPSKAIYFWSIIKTLSFTFPDIMAVHVLYLLS